MAGGYVTAAQYARELGQSTNTVKKWIQAFEEQHGAEIGRLKVNTRTYYKKVDLDRHFHGST